MMCWRLSLLLLCALAAHGRHAGALSQGSRNGELYNILRLTPPAPLKDEETSPTKTTVTEETTSVSTESPDVTERNNETRKDVKRCFLDLEDKEQEDRVCKALAGVNVYPQLSRPSFRSSLGSADRLSKPDFSFLTYQPHFLDGSPSNREDQQTEVFNRLWQTRNKKTKESNFETSSEIYSWKPEPEISSQTHSSNSSPRKSKPFFRPSRFSRIQGSRRG